MTQIESAQSGTLTPEMTRVAQREHLTPENLRRHVAAGHVVIPANRIHLAGSEQTGIRLDPAGFGRPLTTKINANLGASPLASSPEEELVKMKLAVKCGADAVMDLSTGGDLDASRTHIIEYAVVPIGTVPLYEMIIGRNIEDLEPEVILSTIAKQAAQGVDFFTIHCALLRKHLPLIKKRTAGIVSRGGALLAKWMTHHGKENPLYDLFDEIAAIMREYDVTFSLGDALRPGCLADATDEAQLAELHISGELVHRARDAGCQVMVEGPGHVPYDQIERNMKLQAEICDGAPFYVLGPLVTDVAAGYDHISSAIGATAAAVHGASFLCYVTPREHLGLPDDEDVRQGVIAHKIAAHAADVARRLPGARDWDDAVSKARSEINWPKQFELSIDPDRARKMHDERFCENTDYCAMCGKAWCAIRISRELTSAST